MNLTQTEIDRLADEYDRKLFPVTQPFLMIRFSKRLGSLLSISALSLIKNRVPN